MDKKSIAIIALASILAITLVYFLGLKSLEGYCQSCRQEAFQNTMQGMVDQIKLRNSAISIKVGEEQLICSTRELLGGEK